MASRNVDDLESATREKCRALIAVCAAVDCDIFITSTYRSNEEQDALYAKGRTAPGKKVTNAKAGQSAHNHRVAFDIAFKSPPAPGLYDGDWERVGKLGEALGLVWGARWKSFPDKPHFEHHSARQILRDARDV